MGQVIRTRGYKRGIWNAVSRIYQIVDLSLGRLTQASLNKYHQLKNNNRMGGEREREMREKEKESERDNEEFVCLPSSCNDAELLGNECYHLS